MNAFKFEPVATLASLQVLAAAILMLVAFTVGIPATTLALIGGVVQALFAVLATFVRGAVVPSAKLDKLAALTPEQLKALIDAAPNN